MNTPFDFSGKVALVTGSSRGIGAGLVRAFNMRGARCVVNYVPDSNGKNLADAQTVASQLNKPLIVAADVGDAGQVAAMFQQISQELGGLDILINNAAILRDRTIRKMSQAEWDAVLRVNLDGAFHCIQRAAAMLRPNGRVVNLASVSGQLGLFGQANYAASKAGVIALTRVAARELAKQQITVNAVAPGFIDTDMTRGMSPEQTAKFLGQVPLGRMGQIDDIVNAILFLCSSMANYITGEVLNINGGFFMG